MLYHVHFQLGVVLVQVALEVVVRHLVEVLELAKVLTVHLNGVVCQMDELIVKVVETELLGTGAYVAILIEPALVLLVDAADHREDPEVKLPLMN